MGALEFKLKIGIWQCAFIFSIFRPENRNYWAYMNCEVDETSLISLHQLPFIIISPPPPAASLKNHHFKHHKKNHHHYT